MSVALNGPALLTSPASCHTAFHSFPPATGTSFSPSSLLFVPTMELLHMLFLCLKQSSLPAFLPSVRSQLKMTSLRLGSLLSSTEYGAFYAVLY